jgi:hypothetical protein
VDLAFDYPGDVRRELETGKEVSATSLTVHRAAQPHAFTCSRYRELRAKLPIYYEVVSIAFTGEGRGLWPTWGCWGDKERESMGVLSGAASGGSKGARGHPEATPLIARHARTVSTNPLSCSPIVLTPGHAGLVWGINLGRPLAARGSIELPMMGTRLLTLPGTCATSVRPQV